MALLRSKQELKHQKVIEENGILKQHVQILTTLILQNQEEAIKQRQEAEREKKEAQRQRAEARLERLQARTERLKGTQESFHTQFSKSKPTSKEQHVNRNVVANEKDRNTAVTDPIKSKEKKTNLENGSGQRKPKRIRKKENIACNICDKVFSRKDNRDRHKLIHYGIAYPCDECGFNYARQHDLLYHNCKKSRVVR